MKYVFTAGYLFIASRPCLNENNLGEQAVLGALNSREAELLEVWLHQRVEFAISHALIEGQ